MRRVLLVSWLFPPHASVGARRPWRFARALPSLGWHVTVLTGRAPPARLRDPTPRDLPEGAHVVEDYDPAWLASLASWLDAKLYGRGASPHPPAHERAAPLPPRDTALTRVRARFDRLRHDAIPTETVALHVPHATRAAERILRAAPHDAIVTTSYPYSSHLVGAALAERHRIPWIADLRDPWTLNFVHEQKHWHARAIEQRLEQRTFARAAAVTVTTDALADAYRALYPAHAEKVHTVRNGFEPVALGESARDGVQRLVHFGHVYAGARTLRDYIDALALLRREGALEDRAIRLEALGRLPDDERAYAHAQGVGDLLHPRPPLPYAQGLTHLRGATALLLPAWGTERGSLFLPAKLYDYLLAGRPIVAVGASPELAKILSHTRAGVLFAPGDVRALASHLRALLDGAAAQRPDAEAVAQYSSMHAARRFAAVLDAVCAR